MLPRPRLCPLVVHGACVFLFDANTNAYCMTTALFVPSPPGIHMAWADSADVADDRDPGLVHHFAANFSSTIRNLETIRLDVVSN